MRCFIVRNEFGKGCRMAVDPTKWDWADALVGGVIGLITGLATVFGWINGKLGQVHERIDQFHVRVSDHATNIAVLTAHHENNLQFQERMDHSLTALNEKNDEQMKILLELKGRH